jgi:hypothetical protein
MFSTDFRKKISSSIKFHQNPSSGSRVSCGLTDRRTWRSKQSFAQFCLKTANSTTGLYFDLIVLSLVLFPVAILGQSGKDQKVRSDYRQFCLLFCYNLMSFGFEGMRFTFVLGFSGWDCLYSRKVSRKRNIRNEVALLCATWCVSDLQ